MTIQDIDAHVRLVASHLRDALVEANDLRAVSLAIDQALGQLSMTGLWGRENLGPSSVLWEVVGDILQRGWLQNRARTKPLGYAGDHQMLAAILQRRLCDDPLGQWMDEYFQSQSAPQAVRNRTQMVADQIVAAADESSDTIRVVSIGSGPGADVQLALERLGPRTEQVAVTLLDYDPKALAYAQQQLEPFTMAQPLLCHQVNLARLPRRSDAGRWLGQADVIVCTGLMDYLNQHEAAGLLRMMCEHCLGGGNVVAFNFSTANTSRAYMEWIGNWYLVYRTEEDMHELIDIAQTDRNAAEVVGEASGASFCVKIQC